MAPADQSPTDRAPQDAEQARPPVLLAMVVADPGDWFDTTLGSIRDIDYDQLRVVVIDAGEGDPDELERWVHTTLPDARVVDAGEASGFAQAANRLLDGSVRAPYVLLCHDDVAFAPDTIEILVGESERSDAAVVGPQARPLGPSRGAPARRSRCRQVRGDRSPRRGG